MTDTKTIVRILAAVRAEQGRPVFNISTVSEQVLRKDTATRDRLALMLQKELRMRYEDAYQDCNQNG